MIPLLPCKSLRKIAFFLLFCLVLPLHLACEHLRTRPSGQPVSEAAAGTKEIVIRPAETGKQAPVREETPVSGTRAEDAPSLSDTRDSFSDSSASTVPLRSRTPRPILERVTNAEPDVGEQDFPIESGLDAEAAVAHSDDARPAREEIRKALFPPSKGAAPRSREASEDAESESPPSSSAQKGAMLLNTFPFHYGNARRLMEIGESERALSEFRKALELDPSHLEGRLAFGECLEKLGNIPQALGEYQTAATQHPQQPRPHLKIGNLYLQRAEAEDLDRARAAYKKALEIKPDYLYALHNLGLLEKAAGRREEAIAFFEETLRVDNRYASAHLNLGLLFQSKKEDLPEAIRHFAQYLEIGGEHAETVRSLLKRLSQETELE